MEQKVVEKKQKRLGPAPIASFEDISEDVRQKMETVTMTESRLPEIKEHPTPTHPSTVEKSSSGIMIGNISSLGVQTPSTPRIDISRASSSSHHEDSRDSSPENVFDQVGTGTLQESCLGGFREDGALDLRSSTEELYFMDPDERSKTENRDQVSQLPQSQSSRRSPIMFKFDEQQATINSLHQHHRKDSASSEVAALLSISGRTSRISSVGSQGSAVSRLSAISGVSRSPSPHRMLLETSFCGPKPVDSTCDGSIVSGDDSPAEILEQVILARKHDPTQAVVAEGIQIDLDSSPKKHIITSNDIESTAKRKHLSKNPEVTVTKPQLSTTRIGGTGLQLRKTIGKKDAIKPVVGVTPSGTEYIRIKLKPDHMYDDKGLAANERVIDGSLDEVLKKPISLNLDKKPLDTDIITRHPESLIKTSPSSTIKNASPKPARHIALSRDQGSRSPSPATVTVSRKSSFCSLFKSKDAIASPDSPRDRSRSKSRERSSSGCGVDVTSTPNKQKSVLAIFKPARKLSGSKSKSTSPIDPDSTSISHLDGGLSQVEFRFEPSQSCGVDSNRSSRSRDRLRYYDTPLEGNVIHIPLHTPPEEKDVFKDKSTTSSTINGSKAVEFAKPEKIDKYIEASVIQKKVHVPIARPSTIATTPKDKSSRGYRIENPDGSIRIPLHSPPSNNESDSKEVESTWSMEVQRHSSQESQETVISNSHHQHPISLTPTNNIALTSNSIPSNLSSSSSSTSRKKFEKISITTTTIIPQNNNNFDSNLINNNSNYNNTNSAPEAPPPTPASATMREKKHILFSTRIGSGSEEQIFSTQFSLSKTESLSSQISEQAAIFDAAAVVPQQDNEKSQDKIIDPNPIIPETVNIIEMANEAKANSTEVVMRPKKPTLQEELSSAVEHYQDKLVKDDFFNANRHSMYIENIDEIMEAQKKLTASLTRHKRDGTEKNSDEESPVIDHISTKHLIDSKKPKLKDTQKPSIVESSLITTVSSDYQGSSESEKDSENESSASSARVKRHHIRNLGVIDDHESTGLVSQQSFEEDLPYVPTTLPEERSMGVSLIPVKERAHMELRMCPVERPRSTTPINPASLEEYCGTIQTDDSENIQIRGDKLKISLPRRNSKDREQKMFIPSGTSKSPRRISNTSQKSWFEFAAEQGGGGGATSSNTLPKITATPVEEEQPPPPLPPRRPITQLNASASQAWINFEDIPEKKKMPKKITTLPLKEQPHHIQYSYVNPEDCQCECHENERIISTSITNDNDEMDQAKLLQLKLQQQQPNPPEDVQPLLEPDHSDCVDRTSDSSVDYSYGDISMTRHRENVDHNLDKPFGMDLSLNPNNSNSNRSSIASQEPQSPPDDSTKNSIKNNIKYSSDYRNSHH